VARIREPPSAEQRPANCYYDLDTRTVMAAVRSLGPQLGGRLLEVGCGAAPYRVFLEPLVRQYVASDYHQAANRVDVVCDGARLGFRSEVFDSVLCTQVLEHVRDPRRLLEEICRVLRPDGVVLLTVPLNSGIHMAPNDYYRFTEFGLRELCARVGLVADVIAERGGRIATAAQSVMLVFEVDGMPSRHLGAAVARRGVRLLCWLVRRWALRLDRRFPKPGNPLGYALLARKPSRPQWNV
jgi:SAM-dependent methyltransferase